MTYSNGYGLVFGAFVENGDLISKIAELPISADEFETIKNSIKLTNKRFRQMIKNKFKLDLIVWKINNSVEIQFILDNPHQDNHFDCVEIMQDIFNQITS